MRIGKTRVLTALTRAVLGVVLLILLLGGTLTLFGYWSATTPAVPAHKLNQLHEGMTKEQVRDLLGNPQKITTDDQRHEVWVYHHSGQLYALTMRFSSQDLLIEYVHDD